MLWTTPLPDASSTTIIPFVLDLDAAGNAYAAGDSFTPMGMSRDIRTIKVSGDGARLSDHQFNGSGNRDDTAAAVAVSAGGDVHVAGAAWNGDVSSGGTANDIMTLEVPWRPRADGARTAADRTVEPAH